MLFSLRKHTAKAVSSGFIMLYSKNFDAVNITNKLIIIII